MKNSMVSMFHISLTPQYLNSSKLLTYRYYYLSIIVSILLHSLFLIFNHLNLCQISEHLAAYIFLLHLLGDTVHLKQKFSLL